MGENRQVHAAETREEIEQSGHVRTLCLWFRFTSYVSYTRVLLALGIPFPWGSSHWGFQKWAAFAAEHDRHLTPPRNRGVMVKTSIFFGPTSGAIPLVGG